VHTAQRDFRSRDQAQVGVGDAVNLCLLAARNEADALQHLDPRHIRRDYRCVSAAGEQAHGILDQRYFQQGTFILEVIKLRARHLSPGFKIDQVQRLGKSHMVLRGEVESAWLTPLLEHLVVLGCGADRRLWMRHVGDSVKRLAQIPFDQLHLFVQQANLLAQDASFLDQGLLLLRVFFLGNRLGYEIAPLLQLLLLLDQPLALVVKANHRIDIRLDVTVAAIFLDLVQMFPDKSDVEHDWVSFRCVLTWSWPLR
jgi:hypothetical protein